MGQIISISLPHDLPENWKETQYVSPGGPEVGLTKQHGYNYLMNQVNQTQLAVLQLDNALTHLFSINLLHNWYFRNPVDQKQGYIVLSGVSYFSDSGLTTKVGTLTTPAKATRVNYTYGTIVISGTTYFVSYNDLRRGYIGMNLPSIDRWVLGDGVGRSHLLLGDSGITLNLGSNGGRFSQDINSQISASHFQNQYFTLTLKVEEMSGGSPSLYVSCGEEEFHAPITEDGWIIVNGSIPQGATALVAGIVNQNTSDAAHLVVSAIKFELGQLSTLAYDAPASYPEQMAICIQYDPNTGVYRGFNSLMTANVLADATLTE